jgi:hypothetical protein
MERLCSIKKDSSPSICRAHNVALEVRQTSREHLAGGVGNFTFLVCPVIGQVPKDEAAHSWDTNQQ